MWAQGRGARGLGAHGARIVVAEIDPASAAAAAQKLAAEEIETLAVPTDVTRPESVDALLDAAAARFGAVDILVNNAGMSARIAAEDYPEADWDRMVALNLTGLFLCMRKTAKRAKEN